MTVSTRIATAAALCLAGMLGSDVAAQTALSGDPIRISRAQGPIVVDGQLNDEGWRNAARVEQWYETNPGDNIEPSVKSTGWIAYDDRYFYAAFAFEDPNPRAIRSPYADHDHISGNHTDYGGVILDTRNDGHSAVLLLATATGIQYDAVTDDDGSGEDSSPDFFWESAARITDHGWTLEMRVPFSSLRYRSIDPQTWGILLYRNYPRAFRYQFFSARLPRGGNCFICRANSLVGLEGLPRGGHVIAAPYATATQTSRPGGGPGSPLVDDPFDPQIGADVKWTPNADNALDLTLKPDFSQVEADTAQITANERFALSYPEKRPFFLEGVELLSTPMRAVYTRTITAPRWGGRATGKEHGFSYTTVVSDDAGGGTVVIPGPNGSSFAPQEFASTVFVGRLKRSFGRNFVSLLATDREGHDGSGYNRVVGPDFQWRPTNDDAVTGQLLYSASRTPNRPDLSPTWNGSDFTSAAGQVQWSHNTRHLDVSGLYKDFGDGFRADTGFIPQVGFREVNGESGWTMRPKGFFSRVRPNVIVDEQRDRRGELIFRQVLPGVNLDARWSMFVRAQLANDQVRSGSQTFGRRQLLYSVQISPTRRIAQVAVDGYVGEEVDFANSRLGQGATINLTVMLNPTDHLELAINQNERWLDVETDAASGRLFTARVSRVRGTYTFTSRLFARLIGQYVSTDNDPSLYLTPVEARSGVFSGSALLAYKVNWQSVLFVGYGDDRELTTQNQLQPASRQIFVKISYAFQR
ncbi:MAG TPA: DUF5916 domain-containing protein [Vicinamibacterales bacterium]|jgi:hypothetical protein